MDALKFPSDKRAHRFFPLEKEDFFCPAGRTDAYTIIELSMIEGRTVTTKKRLIRLLFDRFEETLGISNHDVEVSITESPAYHWGFRGMPGDEIELDYQIDV